MKKRHTFETLESRRLLIAELVSDINELPASSDIDFLGNLAMSTSLKATQVIGTWTSLGEAKW